MSLPRRLVNSVHRLFSQHLLLANTGTAVVLMGAGDVIQQRIGKQFKSTGDGGGDDDYDPRRTIRCANAGFFLGPMGHYWYGFLDGRWKGRSMHFVGIKTALDVIVGPAYSATFWIVVGAQEGKQLSAILNDYWKNFIDVLKLDVCVWGPAQYISFRYVHPTYRVAYACIIQLFYASAISYLKHDHLK